MIWKKKEAGAEQNKIKRTALNKWVIGVTVFITMIGVIVLFKSVTEKIYQERANSLGWTAAKIVQVIDATGKSQWAQLYYVANDFEEKAPKNNEELLTAMDSINHKLEQEDSVILAFDDKGNYYTVGGKSGRWSNLEMLTNTSAEHQITIEEFGIEQREHMVFLYHLPKNIKLQDGITVTHMALLCKMESFEDALQISSIQNSSFTYILNRDGTHVYHQKNQKEFLSAFNIFTALESLEFLHGASAKDIQQAAHENKSLTLEVSKNGELYFVSYCPMGMNDWGMILFVPTDSINESAADIFRSLFVQITLVALSIIMLASFVIHFNSQKAIQKQRQAQRIMQNAAEEATRASKAKSRFLSHMSHDIRTPINGIIGMSHIAQKNIDDKSRVEDCLKKISASSDHLLSLINDVLDMSRIEQDAVQIYEEPLDPVKLLDECTGLIEGQLIGHSIQFVRDYGSLIHRMVLGDPLHLRQIYVNILGNAVKFTPEGGRIVLRATEKDMDNGWINFRVQIEDTGVGMSKEFLTHLYDPFCQEDSESRSQYKGTGLGMAIVKRLLDRMNGNIQVESQPGQGTKFTIDIAHRIAPSMDVSVEETSNTENNSLMGMRVLLAEDNDLNREVAIELLEDEGIECTSAVDGEEAVRIFSESDPNQFDVILMDIMMPKMDGLDASRTIRSMTDRNDAITIPIIALTANAYSDDIEKTQAAGMNTHLTKPMNVDKLYEVLKQYKHKSRKVENKE